MSDEMTPEGGEVAPPEPSQADLLYNGLQNLDTRADKLGELLRPGQDLPPDMDWNTARQILWSQQAQQQEAPEEFDPFAEQFGAEPQVIGYDPQGNPVFDQPTQQWKQAGRAVNLVQDHQFVQVALKVQLGLRQLVPVTFGFEVQVNMRLLSGNRQSERGFTHLARPQQGHCGRKRKLLLQNGGEQSVKHPCNYGVSLHDLQG